MRIALSRVRSSRFTFESEILIDAASKGFRTLAVAIPGHYPENARQSHFRPVVDITKIVLMVAGRLLRQGMAPLGLWRSLRHPRGSPWPSGKHPARPFDTVIILEKLQCDDRGAAAH